MIDDPRRNAGAETFAPESFEPVEQEQGSRSAQKESPEPSARDHGSKEHDSVDELLAKIDLATDDLPDGLDAIRRRGHAFARRALLGYAATVDELHVLGWACALTASKSSAMRSSWEEAAVALRAALKVDDDGPAKKRLEQSLAFVLEAARLCGIGLPADTP